MVANLRRGLIALLAVLSLLVAGGAYGAQDSATRAAESDTCNSGRPIRLADQTWESASFTMHVIKALLEAAFDCKTEVVPGTPAAIETALAQNDIQIIAEIWTGRSEIMTKAIEAGRAQVVGDTLAGGAEQGWYVPDYVVLGDPARGIAPMAPDLRSWHDLPRYKALFRDEEAPSKGRFLNCPLGWVCEKTNTRLLQLHGLDKDFNNFRAGTGAALDSAISSAYDRGQPILFYYWQPAGLMAKYRFFKIDLGPFNQQCWDVIVSGKGTLCASDFLRAHLGVGLSVPFVQGNQAIVRFLERLQFEPPLLNRMILRMAETRASGADMAATFLREQYQTWAAWLPAEQALHAARKLRIAVASGGETVNVPAISAGDGSALSAAPASSASRDAQREQKATAEAPSSVDVQHTPGSGFFPNWSAAQHVNERLAAAVKAYGDSLREVSGLILTVVLLPLEGLMQAVPPWFFLFIVALLSWHATRKPVATVLYVVCLYLIGAVGLWDKLMQTFALVLAATLFAILIGIPVGILAAANRPLRRVLTPVMDVMQTLPSFVYLIPVLMLFGLGKVPALFATVVYAVPPLIRLTILGLAQVDRGVTEAAQSFGVTPWQMLTKVTLPLARPSIMAGINQTTMMALAMVVVASMIGARGLGEDVLAGIQTLDVGRGLQAGVAIVILAIVMDRITQAYGQPLRRRQAVRRRAEALTQPTAGLAAATDAQRTEVSSDDGTQLPQAAWDGQAGTAASSGAVDASAVKIAIRDVYKVFGRNEQRAVGLLRQGADKSTVQVQTGVNVGLAGVAVEVPAGCITCVIGLSGSGKSTLVRHLNRLIDPSAGEILVDGENILALSMPQLRALRRHKVSMVFQGFGLLPHINVLDNVAFGLVVRGETRQRAREAAARWLERVGLAEYARSYPDELSGGMSQRVGLARALATDADVLLMDEAFSALDPLIRDEMQDQLLALQQRLHKTIVFITHDIDEALRLGQHIVILRDGRIEQAGTPEDIRKHPANDYVARFVRRRGAQP